MDLAAAQALLAECFPTKSGLLNLKYLEGKRAMVKLTVKDSPKLPEFVAELEALEARWAEEAPARAARARAEKVLGLRWFDDAGCWKVKFEGRWTKVSELRARA